MKNLTIQQLNKKIENMTAELNEAREQKNNLLTFLKNMKKQYEHGGVLLESVKTIFLVEI
jgi:hypothetical protein